MFVALILGLGLLILPVLLLAFSCRRRGWQKARWTLLTLLFPIASLVLANLIDPGLAGDSAVRELLPWVAAIGYVGAWGV
jgi:hypothetical protein